MVEVVRKAEEKRLWWETRWRYEALILEDQVLLAMMYLRSYTTYLYLWAIFGVSESNAQRKSIKIENILIKSWLFSLPKKTLLQEQLESVIIDATEVQRERPVRRQKKSYSWKKKMHTLKAQLIVTQEWKIMKTSFAQWKVHDKVLYDNSKTMLHPQTKRNEIHDINDYKNRYLMLKYLTNQVNIRSSRKKREHIITCYQRKESK